MVVLELEEGEGESQEVIWRYPVDLARHLLLG